VEHDGYGMRHFRRQSETAQVAVENQEGDEENLNGK
jgi:hypothetical protein